MAFEIVTIRVGSTFFRPQTFALVMSYEQAARSFEAKIKHPQLDQAAMLALLANAPECFVTTLPGNEPNAPTGSNLLLTGHVEKRSPRLGGQERELSISGRSKTGDLVDSSAEHAKGEWRGQKPDAIIRELAARQKVDVESEVNGLKSRDVFRLRPGETIFAAAERLARAGRFTLTDTPEGKLKLAREGRKRHQGEIADGPGWPPLADGSAVFDDSKRFGKVKVRAQAPDGYAPDRLRVEAEASDEAGRQRLRVITPPELTARDDARERARWHRDRAAGEGVTAEVKVVGWRDAGGTIWTPGWNVFADVPDLGLSQDMTIKQVRLEQSEDGTFANLSLVDPRAFGGKKPKGGKSGKQWDLGKVGGDDE
ncbi:baseplate hub protein [Microcystis phage vB_MweS-yong2]|nr:baseplate hub protein [Microcystis phage vB_MweS-yong2]